MIRTLGVPPLAAIVDDVLLGFPAGITAAAAFTGLDLSRVRHVLATGTGAAHLDAAAARWLPAGCVLHGSADAAHASARPDRIHRLARTDGTIAWAVATERDGMVLHAPGDALLAAEAVSQIQQLRAPVAPTVALSAAVVAQLTAAGIDTTPLRTSRRVLVTGGSRSGKSAYAESRLRENPDVVYVATGPPADEGDPPWAVRVRAHRARRPTTWSTAETRDASALLRAPGPPLLVDGVGTWLARTMDACRIWGTAAAGTGTAERAESARELAAEVDALRSAWARTVRDVVLVTDEVGSGVIPQSASGRLFRDELGRLNAALAAAADEVWFVVAGIPRLLR